MKDLLVDVRYDDQSYSHPYSHLDWIGASCLLTLYNPISAGLPGRMLGHLPLSQRKEEVDPSHALPPGRQQGLQVLREKHQDRQRNAIGPERLRMGCVPSHLRRGAAQEHQTGGVAPERRIRGSALGHVLLQPSKSLKGSSLLSWKFFGHWKRVT
jgi:hypothetical protein